MRRSEIEEEKNSKAVATKAVEFTEKWDSDHPTRCCVLGRTPIGKSFCPKLGNTQRKIVTRDEVDAVIWECTVGHTAREIACNMHA